MAKRGPDLIDPRLATALEHPLRIEILGILREGPSSPAEIQRRLNSASLNLVSHHIKVLKELGCIELLETVRKRGAKIRVYRAVRPPILSDEEWDELTPEVRQPLIGTVLRMISNDLAKSLGTGKFDEIPDSHVSRSPLQLDSEGQSEIVALLSQTLERVLEIGDRSSQRLEASDEIPVPVTVAMMHFPTVDSDS